MNGDYRKDLTLEHLREVLHYDPETGKFTWIASIGTKIRPGREAGCKNHGYKLIRIDKVAYRAHRLAWLYMTGKYPEEEIDHVNQVKDDNRFENLRPVSRKQNMKNLPSYRANKSGVTGVIWIERLKKWRASIRHDGKNKYLGIFENLEDARRVREQAERHYGYHPNHGRKAA
jgi:hypothetical protein